MILWLVHHAEELQLDYVYLGFWIQNCKKMAYKSDFRPLEKFSKNGWA